MSAQWAAPKTETSTCSASPRTCKAYYSSYLWLEWQVHSGHVSWFCPERAKGRCRRWQIPPGPRADSDHHNTDSCREFLRSKCFPICWKGLCTDPRRTWEESLKKTVETSSPTSEKIQTPCRSDTSTVDLKWLKPSFKDTKWMYRITIKEHGISSIQRFSRTDD